MSVLLVALPGNEARAAGLSARLSAEVATTEFRRFPDGEAYVRLDTPTAGRTVVVVAALDRPDEKLPSLLFAASAAREGGARRVALVAPYLAYMRQDARFRPGEAVTAGVVARWLSGAFDAIVAVDPHLHRVGSLAELYGVPTIAVSAADAIAAHVRATVPQPVVVGPDAESGRWVGAVADRLGAPCVVLEKVRRGDRDVTIRGADGAAMWKARTPVLLDDIVSTGRTMLGAARLLEETGFPPAVCVGVHAVFAAGAYDELRRAHVARVVTCDTIAHPSNGISLDEPLARGVEAALARLA